MDICSSEYFHYKTFIHENGLENYNDKIQENLSRAWHNWCQGPVPGRGPAVEKHYHKVSGIVLRTDYIFVVRRRNASRVSILDFKTGL